MGRKWGCALHPSTSPKDDEENAVMGTRKRMGADDMLECWPPQQNIAFYKMAAKRRLMLGRWHSSTPRIFHFDKWRLGQGSRKMLDNYIARPSH